MKVAASTRRVVFLLAVAAAWFWPGRAEALMMQWNEVERPVDWTFASGGGRFGIAEEVHVKKWFFNEFDGREVLSVGTAIHFGHGAVTVPCRLMVFVAATVASLIGTILLAMLPSLRRQWVVSRVSDQQLVEEDS